LFLMENTFHTVRDLMTYLGEKVGVVCGTNLSPWNLPTHIEMTEVTEGDTAWNLQTSMMLGVATQITRCGGTC
jgi:hypothetical protein